jgi:DNA repair exonuclease SbcCD ATPase subunit
MLTPTALKVRGFRGFVNEQPFEFNEPVTILFGENHRGKSSALNAVEWALFGDECANLKNTNIRERKDWETVNRHVGASDVVVELKMAGPGGEYIVRRSLVKPPKKLSRQMRLEIVLPGGEAVSGDEAEKRLAHLLRSCSFRDFMTTAYQHQEAIRDIVTQEPRHRDDAIDRLLGLSDYRNLLSSINDAKTREWHKKKVAERVEQFNAEVQARLEVREDQLKDKHEEAIEAGVIASQMTLKAALGYAIGVREALGGLTEEADIEAALPEVPEGMRELARFVRAAKEEVGRLRGRVPEAQEQEELFNSRTEVRRVKNALGEAKGKQENLSKAIRDLDKKHRGQQVVKESIDSVGSELDGAKARLREADNRAALIREAIGYLAQADGEESSEVCPVCGSEAPDLLEKLRRQWEEKLEGESARIGERIEELEGRLSELGNVARQYETADDAQEGLKQDIEDRRREAGELLKKELTPQDDAIALLASEESRINGRLSKLTEDVVQKQKRLDEIAANLEKVRLLREVLELEEKKKLAEDIQQSPEWEELKAMRDRAAEFVDDVGTITDALKTASQEEACGKISAADEAIDAYFRKLTRHPAVQRVKLTHEINAQSGQNKYIFTDQDGNDLMPILSQGDLNALALAIFLGLAAASGRGAPFGIVMLDDPSQSLGSEHKEKLVNVLDEIAASRRVVVATMDREFHKGLKGSLTKAKAEYEFAEWTPEAGARAMRQE